VNFDNQQLQSGVRIASEHQYDQALALAEIGICTVENHEYVKCVDPADDDYHQVCDRDCDAKTVVTDIAEQTTECSGCGRTIYIPHKNTHTVYCINRSERGSYDYVRDLVSSVVDSNVQRKDNGLRYLDTRFEFVMDLSYNGEDISIQLIFQNPGRGITDTIRLFDRSTISILVGSAVTARSMFEDRDLAYIPLIQLLNADESNMSEIITECIKSVSDTDMRSNKEQKGEISKRLYTESRDMISWREFEYCVQSIFLYLFNTSSMLGGEETGEQVPDGVLSLSWNDSGNTYIWDAKYTENPPRNLSGEYEDMSKHLVQFRRESNVVDVFGDVSGFLLISPGIRGSSVTRLAERIQQRLEETGDQWGGSVVHISFDSLLEIYNMYQSNFENIQQKTKEFNRHMHRLFNTPSYHAKEPDEYANADHSVFDVSPADIRAMVQSKIGPQEIEEDRVNLDGYMANISSLDY
jgi:ribosomal protein S27E